jgi:hypothetical protein
MLINLLNLWPVLRPIATCAPLSPHWPLLGSVAFFAPLRFVLRSLGVGLRLVSVVFEIRGGAPVRLEVFRLAPRAALFGPWQLRVVANYRHICAHVRMHKIAVHNIGHGLDLGFV